MAECGTNGGDRRGWRDECRPVRIEHGRDAARGGSAEAIAGPGFVGYALFGGVDMGAGGAAEGAIRVLEIDGAQIAK